MINLSAAVQSRRVRSKKSREELDALGNQILRNLDFEENNDTSAKHHGRAVNTESTVMEIYCHTDRFRQQLRLLQFVCSDVQRAHASAKGLKRSQLLLNRLYTLIEDDAGDSVLKKCLCHTMHPYLETLSRCVSSLLSTSPSLTC